MESPQQEQDRYRALISAYDALDKEAEPRRAAELLLEATSLADRDTEPRKWASLRSRYAYYCQAFDPREAIVAFRDALTVWSPVDDHDMWVACHSGIGTLMVNLQPFGSSELDEAIMHLEAAVPDEPHQASLLAVLYRFRSTGDPLENWTRRVYHLRQALGQIIREQNPQGWATLNNELGIAIGEQPDADFNASLEERIRVHLDSFAALDGVHEAVWIDTCNYLSECYLFRGGIDDQENQAEAERYARLALGALKADDPPALRATAVLTLAKVLMAPGRRFRVENVRECLGRCDEAAALIDPALSPALAASVESFRANALLKLLELGETGHEERLAAHADAALILLQGPEHLRDRRSILQVAGEGMLAAGRYERAAGYLRRALEAADAALAQAESREGRMERIWEFRDTSALLAWCLLKLDDTTQALVELEKGKARFWFPESEECTVEEMKTLVPSGGALLFPNFAFREGAVVIVTDSKIETVWLPLFGKQRLMELQRGGIDASSLGGWLFDYSTRNSRHAEWRRTIDRTGEILYRELWMPVLASLSALGVADGTELVWFPQGGSGVFPVHAAWTADEQGNRRWLLELHAFRYAPSARALLSGASGGDGTESHALVVANPAGDLDCSEFECYWVEQSLSGRRMTVLHGDQALPEAVLGAVPDAGTAHFATHALFDLNRPLRSSLLLAGGQQLSLESMMPSMEGHAPRLVVLSACETAMSRVSSMPDEFLGFPAAFLSAGSRSVLATLWPVDDTATAVLVGRFYRELSLNRLKPAFALREAQNWMRRLTVRELMVLLRDLKSAPAPAGPVAARVRIAFRQLDPDIRPFAEPYFWAPFTISGKE